MGRIKDVYFVMKLLIKFPVILAAVKAEYFKHSLIDAKKFFAFLSRCDEN
jgi:hypothetical protein